jgi:transcriptional antiterminator NusG
MDAQVLTLEGPGTWFVLHTKSRQEKAMAGDLAARKVAHFLPLVTKTRSSGSRKIKVEEPLFPGYLFLRGSQDDVYNADRTKRVAHIITVPNQQRLIWELRNLAMALQNKTPLDPYPYLKEGVRVEVTSGPLRGLQGIIESRSSIDRLILSVEILGRAVSVELQGALLDLV